MLDSRQLLTETERGAMNTIYIGVDFHARQQTICSLKTDEGVVVTHNLKHQDKTKLRAFTSSSVGA